MLGGLLAGAVLSTVAPTPARSGSAAIDGGGSTTGQGPVIEIQRTSLPAPAPASAAAPRTRLAVDVTLAPPRPPRPPPALDRLVL
jgi:hypothetical protein